METAKAEKIWNFISVFVFVLFLIGVGILLDSQDISISDISLLDLLLICIATYRMTRLIVYDRIFKLFRDFVRSLGGTGLGDSVKTLITCPWCAGVWLALINVALFYLVPFGVLFIYILAIAGVATFFQIGVNVVGLVAEEKQMEVREKRKKSNSAK